jgi:predicted AAA+ superfamily ATPase
MKRLIESELQAWAKEGNRKPLVLRGARQVGKTYSVRNLGKSFRYFAEINFEEKPDARLFFKEALSAQPLCQKLAAFTGVPIQPGETLLFFDEAQACPQVLAALRYFYEQLPGLHVIAAGSLLEFALEQIPSLGVGRLTSRFMHPLTFPEFLEAINEAPLLSLADRASFDAPLDIPFHHRLIDHLRTYMLIGGMPAAVKTYIDTHDLHQVMNMLDDLILTFQDDFGKYRKRVPFERLQETFQSVAQQTGRKFVCATVDKNTKSTSILASLELLVKAGLVHQVFHTHAQGLPLGAQIDKRRFKALLFDVGIHQRLSGLDLSSYMVTEDTALVNNGSLAELLTGLHLVAFQSSHRRPELYYWHRETPGANAEVDYVIQLDNRICPVEVKAGHRGGMQSLRVFLKERGIAFGIRASLENFGRLSDVGILPLYAAHRLSNGSLPSVPQIEPLFAP